MAKKLIMMSLALVLTLGACAPAALPSPGSTPGPTPPASPSSTQTTTTQISVTYHRSGGLTGADDTWTISVDGKVSHQGSAANAPEQLTAAQMAELTAAVRAANFMSLEDSYVPQNTCCDRYQYEITVTIGDQSKTVQTIDASPTAPAELTQLVDTLNRLVSTPAAQ